MIQLARHFRQAGGAAISGGNALQDIVSYSIVCYRMWPPDIMVAHQPPDIHSVTPTPESENRKAVLT
jgi:hypothetical protein